MAHSCGYQPDTQKHIESIQRRQHSFRSLRVTIIRGSFQTDASFWGVSEDLESLLCMTSATSSYVHPPRTALNSHSIRKKRNPRPRIPSLLWGILLSRISPVLLPKMASAQIGLPKLFWRLLSPYLSAKRGEEIHRPPQSRPQPRQDRHNTGSKSRRWSCICTVTRAEQILLLVDCMASSLPFIKLIEMCSLLDDSLKPAPVLLFMASRRELREAYDCGRSECQTFCDEVGTTPCWAKERVR